ncbi:MAG TPA: hypothetical protein VH814_25645 [Steroidobacteraceae bacterium]|jgi:hypothetical protein
MPKIGLVAAGYIGGLLIAAAVVAIRVANTSGPEAQASSGMYAFGDAVLFVAVFGVLALVPTGAALYWLRPYQRFWTVVSVLGLGVAITGAAAATLFLVGRSAESPSSLAAWAAFSVLRILLAPVLTPVYLVGAFFTPYRTPRIVLLAAAAVEASVVAFAALVWFLPLLLQR